MRGYNNKYSVKTHVELHIVNPYTLRLPRRYVTHSQTQLIQSLVVVPRHMARRCSINSTYMGRVCAAWSKVTVQHDEASSGLCSQEFLFQLMPGISTATRSREVSPIDAGTPSQVEKHQVSIHSMPRINAGSSLCKYQHILLMPRIQTLPPMLVLHHEVSLTTCLLSQLQVPMGGTSRTINNTMALFPQATPLLIQWKGHMDYLSFICNYSLHISTIEVYKPLLGIVPIIAS